MEQIEVISWKALNALEKAASKIYKVIGSVETNEQMSVFCGIEEDYLELFFSEVDSSYIRHFEDEDEFFKIMDVRKTELGEENYNAMEFYGDDEGFDEEDSSDELDDYTIKNEDDEEEF